MEKSNGRRFRTYGLCVRGEVTYSMCPRPSVVPETLLWDLHQIPPGQARQRSMARGLLFTGTELEGAGLGLLLGLS